MKSIVRRIAGFGLVPLLSIASPLLLLPLLARVVQPEEWVGLAVGQSVGAFGAIVVNFGWSLSGPAKLAGLGAEARDSLLSESLRQRGVVLLAVMPAGFLTAWLIAPDDRSARLLSGAIAVAAITNGLSIAWFAIGLGQPSLMMRFEAAPRIVAVLVSGLAISIGFPVLAYPLILVASSLVAWVCFLNIQGIKIQTIIRPNVASVPHALRRQLIFASTEISGGAYSSLGTAMVGLSASTVAMVVYSSGARLYQLSLISVVVLSQALQSWVVVKAPDATSARPRSAFKLHLALGVVGGLALAAFGAAATEMLFSSALRASVPVMTAFGAAFAFVSVSTSLGRHLLIPARRARVVFAATIIGAVVGIPSLLILPQTHGSIGGALGLALSELTVLVVLLFPSIQEFKSRVVKDERQRDS